MNNKEKNTRIDTEIRHFQKDSMFWHDPNGPFAPLHRINPVRMTFIRDLVCDHKQVPKDTATPFENMQILDVGCGGGLLCEAMCRLGGDIIGFDADEQAIEIARQHAADMGLKIDYHAKTIEAFTLNHPIKQFDMVTALEIIEHVSDVPFFLSELAQRVKPGGILMISTLNKTLKSFLLGKIAAEYILGLVPPGTHTWDQFVKPSALTHALETAGCTPIRVSGIVFNVKTGDFHLNPRDVDVNYIMAFEKRAI